MGAKRKCMTAAHEQQVRELTCHRIVFATQKERHGIERPFVFRSYQTTNAALRERNELLDTTDVSLVDACRASLSVPRYFNSVKLGGWGSFRNADSTNFNPAIEAYVEVRYGRSLGVQCLLCFGSSNSGSSSRAERASEDNSGEGYVDQVVKEHSKQDDFSFRRFAAAPDLSGHRVGDERENIQRVKRFAESYCASESVHRHLRNWARRLVSYRRARAETVRWTRYAGLTKAYPASEESVDSGLSDFDYFASIEVSTDRKAA